MYENICLTNEKVGVIIYCTSLAIAEEVREKVRGEEVMIAQGANDDACGNDDCPADKRAKHTSFCEANHNERSAHNTA